MGFENFKDRMFKGMTKEEAEERRRMEAEIKTLENEVKRQESLKMDTFSAREKLRQALQKYKAYSDRPGIWSK